MWLKYQIHLIIATFALSVVHPTLSVWPSSVYRFRTLSPCLGHTSTVTLPFWVFLVYANGKDSSAHNTSILWYKAGHFTLVNKSYKLHWFYCSSELNSWLFGLINELFTKQHNKPSRPPTSTFNHSRNRWIKLLIMGLFVFDWLPFGLRLSRINLRSFAKQNWLVHILHRTQLEGPGLNRGCKGA